MNPMAKVSYESPEVSLYVQNNINIRRGKAITPAYSETHDLLNILQTFYMKNRLGSQALPQKRNHTTLLADGLHSLEYDGYSARSGNLNCMVSLPPNKNVLIKWAQEIGLPDSFVKYLIENVNEEGQLFSHLWPSPPALKRLQNLLDPIIHSDIFSENQSFHSLHLDKVALIEKSLEERQTIGSAKPTWDLNGLCWRDIPNNGVTSAYQDNTNRIIEPFRPIPVCIKNLVSKFKFIIDRSDHISVSKEKRHQPVSESGLFYHPRSLWDYAASKINVVGAQSDIAHSSESSQGISPTKAQNQALELTLGRHFEGIIDSILELVFNTLGPLASDFKEHVKQGQTPADAVEIKRRRLMPLKRYVKSWKRNKSKLLRRPAKDFFSVGRKLRLDLRQQRIARKSIKALRCENISDWAKRQMLPATPSFTWDHILTALHWQTKSECPVKVSDSLPSLSLKPELLSRAKTRLQSLYSREYTERKLPLVLKRKRRKQFEVL